MTVWERKMHNLRILNLEIKMRSLREELLYAAVLYVRTDHEGNRSERLRSASEWTGIPVNLIDVEEKR